MDKTLSALLLGAYFLGAIPFSLIISRAKGVDLKKIGSGNLGATNVVRALGWSYGITVFCLDALKAALPTYLAMHVFPGEPWIHVGVGLTAVVGHILSVFLKFKGGKGAASAIGVLAIIAPPVCLITFVTAVIIITVTRIVSLASITGAIMIPMLLWAMHYPSAYLYMMSLLALFVIIKHISNIRRLLKGTENRI